MFATFLLALQSSVATPIQATPLVAGQWVYRETREPGTGSRAVSATLLSEDESARLLVRCELGYEHSISIQFLPKARGPAFRLPVSLGRTDESKPFKLEWEQGPIGVFARDGDENELSATETAKALAAEPGRLSMTAGADGKQTETYFDSRLGHDQLRRVVDACASRASASE